MIIDVSRIPSEGQHFRGEADLADLDLADDESLCSNGLYRYNLTAQVAVKDLIVSGAIEMEAEYRCSRCAQIFTLNVADKSFHRFYELDDLNQSVDLTPDIRESMILAFPSYPVCSRECKGLCPRCGKNLNTGACECGCTDRDDRWGALNDLKL